MNLKSLLCLALVLEIHCDAGIVYPKAPEDGKEIVAKRLDPDLLKGLRITDCTNLTVASPFQDYSASLSDLASGRFLPDAKSGSWTYLLMNGTNAVGQAFLSDGNVTINRPFFPNAKLEALRAAEQLPQVQKMDYEVRDMDIPSILFMAVWLHGKSDDIIIPLPPTFGRWNAFQPYSEDEMINLLKPEAEKKLKAPMGFD